MKRIFTLFISLFVFTAISQAQPTTQANNIVIRTINNQTDQLRFDWTPGTPANDVLVVISSGTAQFTPVGPATYNANTDFNAGTDIKTSGTGKSVSVSRGNNNTNITVSNLAEDTDYRIFVYEYTGGGTEAYNITPSQNNPRSFKFHTTPGTVASWWTAPTGITAVNTQIWGGGGGSGGADSNPDNNKASGGGGAGGTYVKSILTTVPTTAYSLTVGAGGGGGAAGANGGPGGDSNFINGATILAKGGDFGRGAIGNGTVGAGGTGTTSGSLGIGTSTVINAGGSGFTGFNSGDKGGGGGTGGGVNGTGASATDENGASGIAGAGNGGDGINGNNNGNPGFVPGGGAGGAADNNNIVNNGASGGDGFAIISFSRPLAPGDPTAAIAGPDISAAENTAGFTITVPGLVATGAGVGDKLTIFQDGVAIPTAPAHTLTLAEINSGSFDFTGVKLTGVDGTKNITAFITNVEGNAGPVNGTPLPLNLDTTPPVFSVTSPAANAFIKIANVGYTLNENTSAGTVKYNRTGGSPDVNHTINLAGAQLNSGATAISAGLPTLVDGSIYDLIFQATDIAGNTSVAATYTFSNITYDITAPGVTSINRVTASPTNANNVDFTVTFTEAVTGVDVTDFALALTGATTATINTVTPVSPSVYTVNVNTIAGGDGSIGLNFKATAAIVQDLATNPNAALLFAGQVYAVDITPPSVTTHSVGTVTTNSAVYTIKLGEAGITYYEVTTNAVPPTPAQIKAGSHPNNVTFGNFVVASAGVDVPKSITGLSPSTPYYIYSVSEDGLTNQSTPIVSDNFTTTAPLAEATISNGAGFAAIPTTTVSPGAKASVFSFQITDAGVDLAPTLISSMTLKTGTGNFFTTFTDLVVAADITDGTTTASATSITGTTIVFGTILNGSGQLGEILNAGNKTYTVKIWLQSPLNAAIRATADNNNFILSIVNTDVATVAGNSSMAGSSTFQGSAISSTATKLVYITPPSNVLLLNTMTPVVIEAVDAFGARDKDITGAGNTIGILSTGTLSSSPQDAVFASGVGTYPGIIHTAIGAARVLSTNSGTLTTVPAVPTFNVTASATSDIAVTTGFMYPTNLQYNLLQATDITNSSSSIVVGSFDIRDGGSTLSDLDGAPTILSSLRLDLGANFNMIRRIALYDDTGTTEIPGTDVPVGAQIITFGGLSLTAPDNNFLTFTVRVSFKPAVTDNAQISLQVTATTSTAASVSSTFAATNAGGAITSTAGNDNRIEITADRLAFTTEPSNIVINGTMSPFPVVKATDNLGNVDIDFVSAVDVSSSGSMVGDPQTVGFTAGVGTYNNIVHNAPGNNLQLTATSGLLIPGNSTFPFTIVAKSSDIVANPLFIGGYPQNIPYDSFQETSNIQNTGTSVAVAAFDLNDGGALPDLDLLPTILTNLSLDLGPNFNVIRRIALFDNGTLKIPGTEQDVSGQIVNFSGFTLSAPYAASRTFTVRVSFKAPVTDNLQFSLTVSAAATASSATSSQFINATAGGAFTTTLLDQNRVEVTADRLQFLQQPTNTLLGNAMSPVVTVQATDILNSRDLDNTATHPIISTGTLSASPQNATFVAGLGTYPTIIHTATGVGLQLQTTSVSLSNTSSTTFNITASANSNIVANAAFGPSNIAYDTFQENANIINSATSLVVAQFDLQDGGNSLNDADGAKTVLTGLTLDLGANFGFIKRIALFDAAGTSELSPNAIGFSEQVVGSSTVNFSGLSLTANDNNKITFTVRVSFTQNVTDNQQFQFTITNATTQANVSSTFTLPAALATAITPVTGNINRIEVTASKLKITNPFISVVLAVKDISPVQQPTPPVIKAVDQFDVTDLDYATNITFSSAASPSTTTLIRDNPAPNAGVYTFPSTFQFGSVGTGTLTNITSGVLPVISSGVINVVAGNGTTIVAGPSAPLTIPSTATTSGTAAIVFKFDVIDDKTPIAAANDDGLPTLISTIVITAGGSNGIDFLQSIGGAILEDQALNTQTVLAGSGFITGSPSSNSITFSGINTATLGLVADGATKNYTLKIFFKPSLGGTLPTTIDGTQFDFQVSTVGGIGIGSTNSTTTTASSTSSGSGKDVVTVAATQLRFTTPSGPISASLNTPVSPAIVLEATDINNNRDLNFVGTITALSNQAGVTMANTPTVGVSAFASGVFNFNPGFKYTSGTNGNIVTLSMTAGGLTITPLTTPVSPQITILSSFESWIKGDPAYTFKPTIPYINYLAANIQPVDITNLNGSYEIARVLLSDGDADGTPGDVDGAPTAITDLSIAIDKALNTTALGHIKKIALYNSGFAGATEIAELPVTGTDITNGFVKFTGLSISAPDDNLPTATPISIRVSFNNTVATIVDQTLLQVRIAGATTTTGSDFLNSPPFIAGINGGLQAPPGVNVVDVVATKIDFSYNSVTHQPGAIAGVNEIVSPAGIVFALDANNILDLDVNTVAVVSAPGTPTANPTGAFTFTNGILDLATIRYANSGDGTLLVTSAPPTGNISSTNTCNHVDVIEITGAANLGGASGVPSGPTTLQAGSINAVLFGIQFRSTYNISSPSADPNLNSFTIDFSRSNNLTFKNFRVYESTQAVPTYGVSMVDVTTLGATLTPTPPTSPTNNLVVTFPTPRPFTPTQLTYTYYVVADIESTVNGSTPGIQLSVLDNGTGTPTVSNVVATAGSQNVNVQGPSFSFASVQPPSLLSSYPALAQDNIQVSQNKIELTFTVPVFSLDGKITLTDANNPSLTVDCPIDNSGFPNGDYLSNSTAANAARPIIFTIPNTFTLQADHQYYITIAPGIFSAGTKKGIADVNNNVFPGITYSGTLYFRTTNSVAPALLGASSTANPPGVSVPDIAVTNITSYGATLSGTFDKKGTAYFLVLSNNTVPTIADFTVAVPIAGTVARGNFAINATTTIAQSGNIVPLGGAFPLAPATMNVWVYGETSIEANHVITKIQSAPYGGAPDFIAATTGPTTTMPTPAANTNTPAGSNNIVTTNKQAVQFCSGSYQVMNAPIIFYEGLTQTFSQGVVQNMNLVLPGGFVFDTSTGAGGVPVYGNLTLQGTDFLGSPGTLTFLSPTVLRVTYINFGNTSRDQIIISNLRILAPNAISGDIFRLGGNGIPSITDGTKIANLSARDAKVVNFNNSYSTSLGVKLPAFAASALETAIPDNYLPSLVTLSPFIPDSVYDHGPSTFAGQGVTINTLNLAGVTKDNPFNITITHTDQNGCISQNAVQYVVYDHGEGIKISNTTPVLNEFQGPYCATNTAFAVNQTNPALTGVTRYINFDNLTVYNLESLSSGYPKSTLTAVPPNIPPISPGAVWDPIIGNPLTPVIGNLLVQNPTPHPSLGFNYFDYSFDDAKILNATPPYVYDIFKLQTSPNSNYASLATSNVESYYKGGSLGTVELTGVFRNASNPQVVIKRRQNIEFYVPAVPVVELVTPFSKLDVADPLNAPGSGGPITGPNNPGTMVFCKGGGLININGWPASPSSATIGRFTLIDPQTSAIIHDTKATPTPIIAAGFTDNGNGTATIDPIVLFNGFKDIKIVYLYNEVKSPCASSGYQIIRITPNPVANFTWGTFPLTANAPLTTSQCAGQQIQFTSSTTITGDATASVTDWSWDFGDVNGSNNLVPLGPANSVSNHTFSGPSGQGSHYVITHNARSNYGCLSLASAAATSPANYTQSMDVGGIPDVKFKLEGVSTADLFKFNSNSTSTPFALTPPYTPAGNVLINNTSVSSNDIIVNYDWDFGDLTAHTPVPNLTPGYSVPLPGAPGSGVVNNPPGTLTPITGVVNTSNISLYNANVVTHNYAVTGKQSANLTVTTLLGCVSSLALQNSYRDIVVLPRVVLPAAVPPSTPAGVYVENFEGATANDWNAWGTGTTPAAISAGVAAKSWNLISSTVSGLPVPPSGATKYWKTHNGTGQYNPLEKSALYSPSLDISNLSRSMISFNSMVQTNISDGVVLEFSTDNLNIADPNKKWFTLGTLTNGEDWYNAQGIAGRPGTQSANDYGWSGNINDPTTPTPTALWLSSKHTLDTVYIPVPVTYPNPNPSKTVFRFALGVAANNAVNTGLGFAVDNVRIGDRTRTILLESFMNASNTNVAEKTENEFINQYISGTVGTEVIKINYHVDFPGVDPFNQDSPADPSSRALFYNISKTPKSVLDGSKDALDRGAHVWIPAVYAVRTLQLAQADIQVTATSGSDGKLHIFADVTASVLTGIPANTVVHVAVLEQTIDKTNMIAAKQSMIKSGETTFTWTLKKLVPSASGIAFGTTLPFAATRRFPATGTIDWAPEPTKLYPASGDLAVAVWLQQDVAPFEVYQVDIVKTGIADPPLVTALEPIPVEKIQVYPVPANHEMNILLPGRLAQPAALQMVDQTGRVSLTTTMEEGSNSKKINTTDLSPGVYILQIDVGNGNITRKKVLIVH